MRFLVTGGYGFIGSAFGRLASRIGDVVVLDKLTYAADPANMEGIKHTFIRGDICDSEVVRKACEGVDMVVHFAAETHVDRAIERPGDFIHTNVDGTYTLLEEARRRDLDFVYISTDEVYGPVPDGVYCDETAPLLPSNPYSASKAAGDRLAYAYHRTYGLRVFITRSSNNYGPGQHMEKFIPRSITRALRGETIQIYGSGKNVRDWLYVEDNARAIMTVIEKGTPGEVYNISGENEMSNNEVAAVIKEVIGGGEVEYIRDRPGHDYRYGISSRKIKELGWAPTTDFRNGLEQTVEWYRNRNPLK